MSVVGIILCAEGLVLFSCHDVLGSVVTNAFKMG